MIIQMKNQTGGSIMWYSNLYRRHLCDMHIADWDDVFLSRFSPETYVENLLRAHINYAMLYFQSHAGLCYYPTKTGKMHRALIGREHLMRDTVDLCHAHQIKVIGYYSLNYNTVEHDRHPEWRMIQANGKSRRETGDAGERLAFASPKAARYGLCCPNHPEYREFVFEQIREMVDYFDCDALFFDMPFWPHPCYCAHCRERWQKEMGGEMPVNPAPGTRDHARLLEALYAWMGEWAEKVRDCVKALRPQMPVEFNYASGIAGNSINGCGERVAQASDYAGGDLYGGMLEHSFTCKFYYHATRNQPFEYMFSRCKPGLYMHTLTKTLDEMKTSVSVTAAHHGATLVIDAIDPVGTQDKRVYDRIGQMFDFEMPYEPFFRGRPVEDAAIYYGIQSKFDVTGKDFTSKTCAVAAADALIRRHIPFGVTGSYYDLNAPVLIAPMLSSLEEKDRLIAYVEAGGVLYLSGGRCKALVERLTGGKMEGETHCNQIYLAPRPDYASVFGWFTPEYPLPFSDNAPILTGVDPRWVAAGITLPYTGAEEIRFASIHSDPPGVPSEYPGIVVRPVGKGKVIWSAVPIEGIPMDEYRDIFMGLLMKNWPDAPFSLQSSAPAQVELTLFRDEKEMLMHAVHLCNDSSSPTLPGFEIRVRTEKTPDTVSLVPGGEEIPFTWTDGYTVFSARPLHIFDTYRLTWK